MKFLLTVWKASKFEIFWEKAFFCTINHHTLQLGFCISCWKFLCSKSVNLSARSPKTELYEKKSMLFFSLKSSPQTHKMQHWQHCSRTLPQRSKWICWDRQKNYYWKLSSIFVQLNGFSGQFRCSFDRPVEIFQKSANRYFFSFFPKNISPKK